MLPSFVKRVPRILLVAAAVFSLLLGMARGYAVAVYEMPARQALQSLPFVLDVELKAAAGSKQVVSAKLAPVPHLVAAYEQMQDQLQTVGAANAWQLEIRDNRNQELTNAYYQLRPYVLEAADRGNHTAMIAAFTRAAADLGLDSTSSFTLADGYAFVQLHAGTDYLYAVEHINGQVKR